MWEKRAVDANGLGTSILIAHRLLGGGGGGGGSIIPFISTWFRSSRSPWPGASDVHTCTRVAAFSPTASFLERLRRELRISFKPYKPVIKTCRPKNDIFDLLMPLRFSFWCFKDKMRTYTESRDSTFEGKSELKINRSVKTPWHRPSMRVARSRQEQY